MTPSEPIKRVSLLLFVAIVFLAALASSGLQIWFDYRETRERTQSTARDVAIVVGAQVKNTVTQADAIFVLLADMVRNNNGLATIQEPANQLRLAGFSKAIPGCTSIALVSPEGWIVALSGLPDTPQISVKDRDFYQSAKRSRELFVGPAMISGVPNNPILFFMSKPVYDDGGNLLAVISAGMETTHFTDFYGLLGFSVNPAITVFKRNGDLVAQYPEMERYVGLNYARSPFFLGVLPTSLAGVGRSISPVDDKPRIGAYQSMQDLDLVIYAGVELDSAFEAWRGRAWRTGMTNAIALTLTYAVFYWGYLLFVREIALRLANDELDRISHIDALTSIPNRRAFDHALANAWTKFEHGGRPLTLMMIDVDWFKVFNDRYGHPAGDACLKKIAAALMQAPLRPVDIVARYGGEEFAVLVQADAEGARAIAERMRTAVQSESIEQAGAGSASCRVVTVSIGMAQASLRTMASSTELIEAADKALYDAKAGGRNRVVEAAA
ncbi:MAG: diguanylate cyclase [Herminiimonas sp.]|nr:diguanylate cyclase [Herminiimonas sp.]